MQQIQMYNAQKYSAFDMINRMCIFKKKISQIKLKIIKEKIRQFQLSLIRDLSLITSIFRAQEPNAPVTYCDHALSGVRPSSVRPSSVRLFTFSTSPEQLDGF